MLLYILRSTCHTILYSCGLGIYLSESCSPLTFPRDAGESQSLTGTASEHAGNRFRANSVHFVLLLLLYSVYTTAVTTIVRITDVLLSSCCGKLHAHLNLRAECRLVASMVHVLEQVRLGGHFVVDRLRRRLHSGHVVFQLDRLRLTVSYRIAHDHTPIHTTTPLTTDRQEYKIDAYFVWYSVQSSVLLYTDCCGM